MAKPLFASPLSPVIRSLSLLSLLSLLLIHLSSLKSLADSHFEGFDADDEDESFEPLQFSDLRSPPLTQSESQPPPPSPPSAQSEPGDVPTPDPKPIHDSDLPTPSQDPLKPSSTGFDFWDEDEFEGVPVVERPAQSVEATQDATGPSDPSPDLKAASQDKPTSRSYTVEIACISFLVMFGINFFTGKRENENLVLAWVTKFATKNSISKMNFRLTNYQTELSRRIPNRINRMIFI